MRAYHFLKAPSLIITALDSILRYEFQEERNSQPSAVGKENKRRKLEKMSGTR